MRFKYTWMLVLLSGCQLTPPEPTDPSTPKTNQSQQTITPSTAQVENTISLPSPDEQSTKSANNKPLIPQEQSDVWQRIGMQLKMTVPDNEKVAYYRSWYLKHPNHIHTVSKRARPFLYMITLKYLKTKKT